MVHKYSKILTKEFLIKEYLKKKKFPKSIAIKLSSSIATIWRYLKKYHIKIRSLSEVKTGIPGHKHTVKTRAILSELRRGKNNPNFGGTFHGKQYHRWGRDNPRYIDGRTPLIRDIYNSKKYREWRTEVFKRDNHICQECGQHFGIKLDAHDALNDIKATRAIYYKLMEFLK